MSENRHRLRLGRPSKIHDEDSSGGKFWRFFHRRLRRRRKYGQENRRKRKRNVLYVRLIGQIDQGGLAYGNRNPVRIRQSGKPGPHPDAYRYGTRDRRFFGDV